MERKDSSSLVRQVFFTSPLAPFSAAEIARRTGLTRPAVGPHLALLEKEGLVRHTMERRGKRQFPVYRANQEASVFRFRKMLANIESLKPLTDHLTRTLAPEALVLIGSYRRGEDTESSDIDIVVFGKERRVDMSAYERALKRPIQLLFLGEFPTLSNELKNNVINGIVLAGYLEAFP